ncbi:hypothetical protein ACEUZ9_002014 [Paracoccus litorisediminis]|uniref:integrase n=1 Tax=Paracoccus litorisediminis TaxID=2006130 RepID=UPI0037339D8D
MAGAQRYLLNRDGRFFARLVVPKELRGIVGKSELRTPLGPDRRGAMKLLPTAVAAMQAEIAKAARQVHPDRPHQRDPITTQDFGRAVWQRYTAALSEDDVRRARLPTPAAIEDEHTKVVQRFQREGFPVDRWAVLDQSLDWLVMKNAQAFDQNARQARLATLRRELAAGEMHQVEHEIDAYLDHHGLDARTGSAERVTLAKHLMRAEIEALERTLERDRGDYGGKPADPIVKPPAGGVESLQPVRISSLWSGYVKSRVTAGFMKDGGIRQRPVIESLRKFLGHNDARQITRRNLLDWRDELLKTLSAKTTNDIYLSTVRSMLKWAHDEEQLSENVAATVRQAKPKKQRARDPGYSDKEALAILKASRVYQAKPDAFGVIREKEQSVAAKRWVPLLCAFAGARVGEMLQLRKEDVRQEGERWVIRITPEAGTMKAGHFRDVPLHRQVITLGFVDHVKDAKDGPLFHGSPDPAKAVSAARAQSNKIAAWLHSLGLVPDGLQPSHAWRHRFKGQARELGLDMRVTDAIQGHAGKSAADDYGDISLIAKARIIEALPEYSLQ